MKLERIFVYGLLTRGADSEMAQLLQACAKFMCTATIRGNLYRVGSYPGAVPSADPAEIIHGEVYRIDQPDLLLPKLDAYEGCGPDDPEPTEYVRRKQQVFLINGRSIYAWVYLYNRSVDKLERIESGRFTVRV